MTSDPAVHVFRPHREAPVLWVLGQRVRILVDATQSAGRYSLVEIYSPPFSEGLPPHAHEDSEELFHVLEGGLKITVGEQTTTARAGDTLIVPRRALHSYANPFLTPCRFLSHYTPAGFERYFTDLGVPPVSATDLLTPPVAPAPSVQQMRTLAGKYKMCVPGSTD